MRFHASISDHESTQLAGNQVIGEAREAVDAKIDVVFLFFTAHHREEAAALVERAWLELDPQCIVGCSAEGVIGKDREIERAPGIALLAGQMPGVGIHPFHIRMDEWRPLVLEDPQEMLRRIGHGPQTRAILAFGDPFTTPLTQLLPLLDKLCPGTPIVGGMASSATAPGENLLIRNDQTHDAGMVGVTFNGPVAIDTLVSQGCRPVGHPMIITRSQENVIQQLGGKVPTSALREMVAEMSDRDKDLLQHGLLVGKVISEYKESFARGDFLVRNLLGADEKSGALAVNGEVRIGQTIQFHVRDAATADEDLSMLLAAQSTRDPAAGALLFSCNGRGTRMFDDASHDVHAANVAMPKTPVAGFFAAGELGPVGGHNFVHGHTASFAIFRPG